MDFMKKINAAMGGLFGSTAGSEQGNHKKTGVRAEENEFLRTLGVKVKREK